MSDILGQAPAPRGHGVKIALAATAASAAVVAFWVSENMPVTHADRWQDAAMVAGALAAGLTWAASQRTPPQKTEARAPSERRARNAESSTLRSELADASKAKKEEAPRLSPIEAERLRLLKAGFNEQEISQILIARESGGGKASFGSGVATGVLNNLEAVATHLRSLVPSIKSDLTRIMDRDADSATRISGAVSLGVKAIAAVVIGYFVYLEALQFRSAAYKAWADACIERQKNAINFSTMNELLSGNGPGHDLDKECAQ